MTFQVFFLPPGSFLRQHPNKQWAGHMACSHTDTLEHEKRQHAACAAHDKKIYIHIIIMSAVFSFVYGRI